MNTPTKIKTSYWGLSFTVITALLLVCMFLWGAFYSKSELAKGWFYITLASVMIVMFGLYAIFGIYQLMQSKPALIIDEEGITNNYAGFHSLHLNWNEIDNIKISDFGLRTNLVIKSKAGAKRIAGLPFISRMYFYLNQVNFLSKYILRLEHYDFHTIGKNKDFYLFLNKYLQDAKE